MDTVFVINSRVSRPFSLAANALRSRVHYRAASRATKLGV